MSPTSSGGYMSLSLKTYPQHSDFSTTFGRGLGHMMDFSDKKLFFTFLSLSFKRVPIEFLKPSSQKVRQLQKKSQVKSTGT